MTVHEGAAAEAPPAALFAQLRDACLGCGQPDPGDPCRDCGGAPGLPPAETGGFGVLGHLVQDRRSGRRSGVAVAAGSAQVTVLGRDGRTFPIPRQRCRTVTVPRDSTLPSSAGGRLLTATGLELSHGVRAELVVRAVGSVPGATVTDSRLIVAAGFPGQERPGGDGIRSAPRRFAADCVLLGRADLLAGLPLPASERTWWGALAHWLRRDWVQAVTELLGLPEGRYPQQLALWWWLATHDRLPEGLRGEVASAAQRLAHTGPAARLAAVLLLRAFKVDRYPELTSYEALVDAATAAGGAEVAPWLSGARGESPAARLVGAVTAGDAERLGTDPSVLDAAPPKVLDDLIDHGLVPAGWLARARELACGTYLLARTRITDLDDAELVAVGAHRERARRAVVAGAALPGDLPPEVAARYRPLAAAAGGDPAALPELVAAAGQDGSAGGLAVGSAGVDPAALAAAVADPAALPDGRLLADRSLAAALLARSTADPEAWPVEDLDPHQRGYAARLALRQAKRLLYEWRYAQARDAARTCLRFAREEDVRDEAQNLIAAAHWQLGNDRAALSALDSALAGEYTAALQINFAVVAEQLAPEQTAAQLSKLVTEAPNLELRVSAARQAVRIWRTGNPMEQRSALPEALTTALRSLVVEPIAYDAFRDLISLLSIYDGDWLKARGRSALAASPHVKSPAAAVWLARARGGKEFVEALAAALRAGSPPEPWLADLRDQLVEQALAEMGTSSGLAGVLLDCRMPLPAKALIELAVNTVQQELAAINPATQEPVPGVIDWLDRAFEATRELPPEVRGQGETMVFRAFATLARVFYESRRGQLAAAWSAYRELEARVRAVPSHQRNRAGIQRATAPAEKLARETYQMMEQLCRRAPNDAKPLAELAGEARNLERRLVALRK